MNKNTILEYLKSEKPYLSKTFGVDEIAVFGSYARGEENSNSDVDLLVKMKSYTLHNYIGIIDYLQSKLKLKVDLVAKNDYLSERFKKLIGKDIIYV